MNDNRLRSIGESSSPSRALHLTRTFVLAGLLSWLALLAAYQVPYTYSMALGRSIESAFVKGFYEAETDPAMSFRWTTANSSVTLPAVVQNQAYQVDLRLAAGPRPSGAPLPAVTLFANGVQVRTLAPKPELRSYIVKIAPQIIASSADLTLQIAVPPFIPSKTITGSSDDRSLGVMVERIEMAPAGPPAGLIAVPPLTQWLGWLVAGSIWNALILRTGWMRTSNGRRLWLLSGSLLLAVALIFARQWVAAGVWYICAALAAGLAIARPMSGWVAELKSTRRIPFGFIHTLGIANPRVRLFVEFAIIVLLAANYLVTVILPLRNQVLGDFNVYYAGTSVWQRGGDPYDQSQLQVFSQSTSLFKGQIGPFTSPPSALLFFAPFAMLPITSAKTAWLLVSFLLLIGSGAFLWLAVRSSVRRPPSAVWIALMFASSQSLQDSFDFGQVNTLYSFVFALGLWAWTRRQSALTGAAMAVGAGVKVFSAIFLPYFLLKRAWQALAAAVLTGAVLVLASTISTSLRTWLDYLLIVLPEASAHRVSAFDQSTLVFLRRSNYLLGFLPDNDQLDKTPSWQMSLIALGVTVSLLLFTAWWIGRWSQKETLHDQVEYAIVIAVMMLVLPRMWEHYLMWLILPFYMILAFIGNRLVSAPAQITIIILLGLGWLLSQNGPGLFTQPDWPTPLISIGLYGTFIIYVCLLYLSSLRSRDLDEEAIGLETKGPQSGRPIRAQARQV